MVKFEEFWKRLNPSFSEPSPKSCCDDFPKSYGFGKPNLRLCRFLVFGANNLTISGVGTEKKTFFRNLIKSNLTDLARRNFLSSGARASGQGQGSVCGDIGGAPRAWPLLSLSLSPSRPLSRGPRPARPAWLAAQINWLGGGAGRRRRYRIPRREHELLHRLNTLEYQSTYPES